LLRLRQMKTNRPLGLRSVLTAVIGNGLVAIFKFAGFYVSGSAVMLSEGIHSIADTANQALLLIGIIRSERPADDKFNYGYFQERFFWALISACGIFFLGAGFTIYHGISSISHHEVAHIGNTLYYVLFLSFIFEGYALRTAIKEAKHNAKGAKIFNYMRRSGDPTIMAVIFEDSAALVGISIAFISIILTKLTGINYWDGIGSIMIGILLGVIAIALIKNNREFLLNRSVPKHVHKKILHFLERQKLVDEIHDFKTVMISSDGCRVKAEIEINGHVLADKIFESRDFKKEYEHIKSYESFVKFCADFSDEVTRTLGKEIDTLEKAIAEEIPTVKHIDIETN